MKVQTQTFKEMAQETYNRHRKGETIRDPHISLYFLQQITYVRDLPHKKPRVKIIHCPSDEESFFLHPSPK